MLYPAELRGHFDVSIPCRHSPLCDMVSDHSQTTNGEGTTMAAIDKRLSWNGKTVYRAKVRLKDYPPQVAQFPKLADARRWGEQTEAAIREGRYFPKIEGQRHTVKDMIERYQHEVLPHKRRSTIP